MKKYIFSFFLFCVAIQVNAQYFELTPNGFVNAKDPEMDYVVIDLEGKSQQQIFDGVNQSLHTIFVDPKSVLSPVPNDMITVNAIAEIVASMNLGAKAEFDVNYTLVFRFKDGRLRVDAPSLQKMVNYDYKNTPELYLLPPGGFKADGGRFSIFAKNGKLKNELGKQNLEDYFNNLIDSVVNNFSNPKDQDW